MGLSLARRRNWIAGGGAEGGYWGDMKMLFRMMAAGAVMGLAVVAWAPGARAAEKVLRVLETTDMHGAMTCAPVSEQGRWRDAGLARLATVIRQARESAPGGASLLLDSGDYLEGTLESSYSHGRRMVEAMNVIGYDAVGIGNHEFDWGVDEASAAVGRFSMPVVSANLLTEGARQEEALFENVRPYILKDVGGLRVAIVGLTTPNLPHWYRDFGLAGLRTSPSVETLEKLLPELRRHGPDIMILLVHQGLRTEDDGANEINAIGACFPEFDVVLGGHLHWVLPGARVGHADYGQAGAYAGGVLQVDLTYDEESGEVTDKEFRFLPVAPDTPADERLAELFREDAERAAQAYEEVLGRTERPLGVTQTPPALSPMQQLFARSMMAGTGAEAAFAGSTGGERLLTGTITMRDLWRVIPYENGVGVAWLTKDEIRQVMEEAMQYLGTTRYVALSGLAYDLYPNAEAGRRVRNLRRLDGEPLNGRRRIPVAMSSYLISGAGGRYPVLEGLLQSPHARVRIINDKNMRDLVADYVRANSPLRLESGHEARVFRRERRLWERRADFEQSGQ